MYMPLIGLEPAFVEAPPSQAIGKQHSQDQVQSSHGAPCGNLYARRGTLRRWRPCASCYEFEVGTLRKERHSLEPPVAIPSVRTERPSCLVSSSLSISETPVLSIQLRRSVQGREGSVRKRRLSKSARSLLIASKLELSHIYNSWSFGLAQPRVSCLQLLFLFREQPAAASWIPVLTLRTATSGADDHS